MSLQRRRDWLAFAGACAMPSANVLAQATMTFEQLLQSVELQSDLLVGGNLNEGRTAEFATRAIAPKVEKSKTVISENAIRLITLFEVTSSSVYEKRYRRPVVPALESGVTVGVGYDLGYVKPEWLYEDWKNYIPERTIEKLAPVCLLRGSEARAALKNVRDVEIPWDAADMQFRAELLPKYVALTEKSLPFTNRLSRDSLGALTSLVYNRGAPFTSPRPRFKEMRNIRFHMEKGQFPKVPDEIIAMKYLWAKEPGARGLLVRRDLEAALFKQGLS